jgi:hypothetical protein
VIANLRRLLAEGTPGPWYYAGDIESVPLTIASFAYDGEPSTQYQRNAALIVAAVNALPALLDVVEALTDEDQLGHGEAVFGGNPKDPKSWTRLGSCAYDDEPWPCPTQRKINALLAALEDPTDG